VKYMLLIYGSADGEPKLSEDEERTMMADYFAFTQRIVETGEMVAGEPLHDAITSVRVRGESTLVTDGPFAETKEILGGFYLVDVASLERAHELAAQIPSAKWGRIEVRPLMELPPEHGAGDAG
jgi:hypothetical protein